MSGSATGPPRARARPGQAPLVAPNAAALLRRNAADPGVGPRPAIRFEDRVWSHAEYFAESCRWANLFLARLPEGRPRHVAVLLDNVPEYLFAFGGAALIGGAVVGLNHTRRGEHLLRDATHTDCGLVVTETRHLDLLASIRTTCRRCSWWRTRCRPRSTRSAPTIRDSNPTSTRRGRSSSRRVPPTRRRPSSARSDACSSPASA